MAPSIIVVFSLTTRSELRVLPDASVGSTMNVLDHFID